MALAKKNKDLSVFFVLNVTLWWPAWVAQKSIVESQQHLDPLHNPSPYGYTWSLVLFLFPCFVFGTMLFCKPLSKWIFDPITIKSMYAPLRRKAFLWTVVVLIPLGAILDFALGTIFFTFSNSDAVVEALKLPALYLTGNGPQEHRFYGIYIPIEEMAFYALGFLAILLIYIWSENVLFRGNKVDMRQATPRILENWKRSALFWFIIGLIVSLIAIEIRKNLLLPRKSGFPGYFLFLLWFALLPSMFLFHISFHFINWRALTVSWLFILAISQFWEGVLGVPYQWWDYNPDQMLGIRIKAECDLPVEAILVWSLCSWTTVVVYEWILARLNFGQGGQIQVASGGIPPHLGPRLAPQLGLPPQISSTATRIQNLKIRYKQQLQ